MRQLLPFLIMLACPLLMLLMHRKGSHGAAHENDQAERHKTSRPALEQSSIEGLRELRNDLYERLEELDDRIEELERAEAGKRDSALAGV